MPQTKHQIQSLLAEAGGAPRRRFGQNFMIDQNLVRLVADAGLVRPGELVIEVGPGTGTLTEELLERGARVVAVEIDPGLATLLRRRLGQQPQFELIEGDALAGKHRLNPQLLSIIEASLKSGGAKLVSNLPYNAASPLVIEMLLAGVQLLAFTVQNEVADRLRARPGTEQYGTLTIMAQLLARVEVLRVLPPQAFWPAPKVHSALVRLTTLHPAAGGQPSPGSLHEFGAFVARLFSARRKTLRRAMAQAGAAAGDDDLARLGLDPNLRPEALSPQQCLELYTQTQRA